MYLMIDIVLNHTSHHHEWAKSKSRDTYYQDFFYMFNDRYLPDQFEKQCLKFFLRRRRAVSHTMLKRANGL